LAHFTLSLSFCGPSSEREKGRGYQGIELEE
jgi:hypothetical protein